MTGDRSPSKRRGVARSGRPKPSDAVTLEPRGKVAKSLQKKYGKHWRAAKFSTATFLAERKAIWGEE